MSLRTMSMLLVLSLSTGNVAMAKGKKSGPDHIMKTELQSVDRVFNKVTRIDGRLSDAEGNLRTAKKDLNNSLQLKQGTPLTDGLRELRARADGKLKIVTKGAVPKLEATEALPTNLKNAVNSVNSMTSNIANSLQNLAGVEGEVRKLVTQSKALPMTLKDEVLEEGNFLDLIFTLPKTTKAVTNNIRYTAALPGKASRVVGRLNNIMGVVTTEFAVGKAPAKGGKGKPKAGSGRTGGGKSDGGTSGGGSRKHPSER